MKKNIQNSETEKFFIDFLATKKLRLTSQRRLIFNELMNRKSHIDIDELFIKMKSLDSNMGLATIYRTLKLLTESGILREVHFGNDKPLYEAVIGREHHDHLICSSCGENIEFTDPTIESLQEKIAKKYEYKLTGHALYLTGLCKKCASKETKSS